MWRKFEKDRSEINTIIAIRVLCWSARTLDCKLEEQILYCCVVEILSVPQDCTLCFHDREPTCFQMIAKVRLFPSNTENASTTAIVGLLDSPEISSRD